MPPAKAKARVTFAELCARLQRHGFSIRHLSQYDQGDRLHLQIVVMNDHNLAVEEKGEIGPPYYGEDLFYRVASKVALFRG